MLGSIFPKILYLLAFNLFLILAILNIIGNREPNHCICRAILFEVNQCEECETRRQYWKWSGATFIFVFVNIFGLDWFISLFVWYQFTLTIVYLFSVELKMEFASVNLSLSVHSVHWIYLISRKYLHFIMHFFLALFTFSKWIMSFTGNFSYFIVVSSSPYAALLPFAFKYINK